MVSKVLSIRGKAALVAGLTWHPLIAPPKKRNAEIRDVLSDNEVEKIALTEVNSNHMLGIYVSDSVDDDIEKSKPSALHSVALSFSSFVGDGNAVLAYAIPDSNLAAIILIEAGIPNLDDVKMVEQVQVLLDGYSNGSMGFIYNPYTNDQGYFPNATIISDDELWENTSKKTLLVGKPLNIKYIIYFILFCMIAGLAFYGYKYYDKTVKEKQRIAERMKNDPVLKYTKSLESNIGSIGISGPNALAVIKVLEIQKIRDSGWNLTKIECSVASQKCVSTWDRDSGFTDKLIQSRSLFGDVVIDGYSLNRINFIIKSPLSPSGFGSYSDLPSMADFNKIITKRYQKIENAGIIFNVMPVFSLWPDDTGAVLSSIPADKRVVNQAISFKTSFLIGKEVIEYLPSNYFWTDIEISISTQSAMVVDSVSLSLKGSSYVRQE